MMGWTRRLDGANSATDRCRVPPRLHLHDARGVFESEQFRAAHPVIVAAHQGILVPLQT